MLVRDAIVRTPVITVRADDTIEHAARLLLERGIRHLPVLDGERLVGVLSERDVLAYRGYGGMKAPVSTALARTEVEKAAPGDDLEEVARRMASRKVGCLPVVDEGKVIGLLTTTDLLAGFVGTVERVRPELDLSVTVGEVMTGAPLTVHPDDRLLDAVGRMSNRGVRHLPVVDGDRRPLGMLSDRDVRRTLGETAAREGESGLQRRVTEYRVQEVARIPAVTVDEDASLREVVRLLVENHIGALAVVDDVGRLTGVVSYVDVLTRIAGLMREPTGVVTVPPEAMMPMPT